MKTDTRTKTKLIKKKSDKKENYLRTNKILVFKYAILAKIALPLKPKRSCVISRYSGSKFDQSQTYVPSAFASLFYPRFRHFICTCVFRSMWRLELALVEFLCESSRYIFPSLRNISTHACMRAWKFIRYARLPTLPSGSTRDHIRDVCMRISVSEPTTSGIDRFITGLIGERWEQVKFSRVINRWRW